MIDYCFHLVAVYYLYIINYEVKYDITHGKTLITFRVKIKGEVIAFCMIIDSEERISDIVDQLDIAVLNNHGQRRY